MDDEGYISDAVEELKRAEHLIYVSLKYTRTCDIIKHVIERLIACYDFMFNHLLEKAKDQNEIEVIPFAPAAKAESLKKLYADNDFIQENLNFYLFLRKLSRAKFTRRQEYRRHVTMTTILDDGVVETKIDHVQEHFNKTKEFIEYVKEEIEGQSDLD